MDPFGDNVSMDAFGNNVLAIIRRPLLRDLVVISL